MRGLAGEKYITGSSEDVGGELLTSLLIERMDMEFPTLRG
jgi:hypothetical protein